MKIIKKILVITATIIMLCVISVVASAETYGDLTYTVSNGEVTITGCKASAKTIEIPETINGNPVVTIGKKAFYNCTSLTSVTIPKSITTIGSDAFNNCAGLTKINWNAIKVSDFKSSSSVFYKAGYSDDGIDVVFGDNVEAIPAYCFYGYDNSSYISANIKSVTIGNSVTTIGRQAFRNCWRLAKINWNAKNVSDFTYSSEVFINAGEYGDGIDTVFGADVEKIPAYLFYASESLFRPEIKSVTIGNSVTSIGDSAFNNCTGLTKVNISDIASWCTINFGNSSSNPLYYAENLYINNELIKNLIIPDSVTSIGDYAFYNCSGLTSITISATITSIGDSAFNNCTGLTKVNISDIASWCMINFGNSSSNPLYYADNLYINNTLVENLIIPESVTFIGSYAFSGYTRLTNIIIPDSVTSIGCGAFCKCAGLTSITIPDSVTTIGDSTFYGCTGLASITIPNSVTTIGDSAFYGCTWLASITIPNSVTTIGSRAFYDCTGLASITIPDSVTTIGSRAFYDCAGLTSITIPDSVTTIGDCTFYDCTGLASITIPDSVTTIGMEAFSGCTGLTSITIPDSVTTIGSYAFYDCTKLTSINWNVKNVSDFSYNSRVFYNAGTSGDGIDVVFGDNVETIPKCLFFVYDSLYRPKIKNITISNSVTTIGSRAFYGCKTLTEITIPDSVTSIGSYSFYGCSGLENFTIGNSVSWIGASALGNCTLLKTLSVPESVRAIGDAAFENCSSMKHIYLYNPNCLTTESANNTIYQDTVIHSHTGCSVDAFANKYGYDFMELHTVSDEWTSNATCGQAGQIYRLCKYCDEKFDIEDAPATGNHTDGTEIRDAVAEDCGNDGYTGDTYCLGCNTKIADGSVIPATGTHNHTSDITTAATCKSTGVKTYTCSVCGDTYTETIAVDSTNHVGGTEIRDVKPSTCTENGYTGDTYCKDCNTKLSTGKATEKIAHKAVTVTGKAATCTATGLTAGKKCSVCGEILKAQDEILATGHKYTPVVTAPTCTEKGFTTYTCPCGDSYVDNYVDSKGHTEEIIPGKAAICTATGLTEGKKCSVCGEILKAQEIIEMLLHTFGEWVVVKAPTATEEGSEERVCSVCGEKETRNIEKLSFLVGDANSDGKITAADARIILRIASKLEKIEDYNLPLEAFDVTRDSKLTAADARKALRISAKIET